MSKSSDANDRLLMATRAGDARKVRELLASGALATKRDAHTGQSALDLAKAHPLLKANNEVLTVLFEAALQEKGMEARRSGSKSSDGSSSSSAISTRNRDVRPAMGPSGAAAARGARGVVGPEAGEAAVEAALQEKKFETARR